MPSSTFTPSNAVDMSKEKDWPANLGMLDWDNTSIVFTKRSLIEFLKYTGTTVDTNFANIGKLPRYARFGAISAPDASLDEAGSSNAPQHEDNSNIDGFKPTRRVRTVPGGPHSDIFGHDDEGDALSQAPPKTGIAQPSTTLTQPKAAESQTDDTNEDGINFSSGFRPTRRVREQPGGKSSLSNFWDAEDPAEFKPTRRVREGPGGQDSINNLF